MRTNLLSLALIGTAIWAFAPSSAEAQITVGNADTGGTPADQIPGVIYGVGEVFVAPSTLLTSVSVNVNGIAGGGPVEVALAQWNSASNTAFNMNVLGTPAPGHNGAATISFGNLNLNLIQDADYLLIVGQGGGIFTAATSANPPVGSYDLGLVADVLGYGSNGGNYTTDVWTSYAPGGSTALSFQATFAAVPETRNFTLAGLVLCLGVAIYYHRRRNSGPTTAGFEGAV